MQTLAKTIEIYNLESSTYHTLSMILNIDNSRCILTGPMTKRRSIAKLSDAFFKRDNKHLALTRMTRIIADPLL